MLDFFFRGKEICVFHLFSSQKLWQFLPFFFAEGELGWQLELFLRKEAQLPVMIPKCLQDLLAVLPSRPGICVESFSFETLLKTEHVDLKIHGWKMQLPFEIVLFSG